MLRHALTSFIIALVAVLVTAGLGTSPIASLCAGVGWLFAGIGATLLVAIMVTGTATHRRPSVL